MTETEALRVCLRDAMAFSSLPALWRGLSPQAVLDSAAEALLATLRADLVVMRLNADSAMLVSVARGPALIIGMESYAEGVAKLMDSSSGFSALPPVLSGSDGAAPLHLAGAPIGFDGGHGSVIAGAVRPGFPSEYDRLLISFGAGQTAIGVRAARADAQLAEHISQITLTAETGVVLTGREALDDRLQRCAEIFVRHLGAALARIWTFNTEEEVLELRASAGLSTQLGDKHSRIPLGTRKIGTIGSTRRPNLTNQVIGDPLMHDQEWARQERIVAFAGYPLVVDDRLLGVLGIFAREPLPDSVLPSLGAVADEIALVIQEEETQRERARLLRQEQEARAEVEALHQVGQTLASELDLETLVQAATDSATQLSGAEFGAFFYNIVNQQGESYLLYALSGAERSRFAEFPLPRNTPIFAPTFSGMAVRIEDVTKDPRYGKLPPHYGLPTGHLPVRSYLAVPVIARGGQVLGGLFLGHSQPGLFIERHQRLVEGVAAQCAIAMDNARLYRQLQGTLRIREEFLAAAAHDLKTPMTSVRGMAQLLRRRVVRGATQPEQIVQTLSEIEVIIGEMNSQIDELLDVSRLEMGQTLYLDRRPTDLLDLTRRVVSELEAAGGSGRILIECALPEVTGLWDESRVMRVVNNLLSNALKFSPRGSSVEVHLSVDTLQAPAQAVLSVTDRGVGVPQADLPHIFQRFYRASNVIRDVPGTGIGLSSVRSIVEGHGGTVEVQSEEGAGSTFTVRLPLDG